MVPIIITGAPSSGKGTYCNRAVTAIEKAGYSVKHVSTGDMFRAEVKKQSPLGLECKEYMDRGDLIPNNLINKVVSNTLLMCGDLDFVLLDGYPRTVDQAKSLIETGLKGMTILIDTPLETILERSAKRLTCADCGSPTTADNHCCPKCGSKHLERRADEDKITERYNTFIEQTIPAIDELYAFGPVLTVDGSQEVSNHIPDLLVLLKEL